jgi:hypothetical protein
MTSIKNEATPAGASENNQVSSPSNGTESASKGATVATAIVEESVPLKKSTVAPASASTANMNSTTTTAATPASTTAAATTTTNVSIRTSPQSSQDPNYAASYHPQQGGGGYYQYQNQVPYSPPHQQTTISLAGNNNGGGGAMCDYENLMTPLSPPGRDIGNAGGGNYRNNNSHMNNNLPPASPLFPGALPLYTTSGSSEMDNSIMNGVAGGPSMFAPSTTSNSFQYATGLPPPSPVVSYGYPISIPNSPDGWNDRYVCMYVCMYVQFEFCVCMDVNLFLRFLTFYILFIVDRNMYNTVQAASSPHLQALSMQYQSNLGQSTRTRSFDGGEMLPPPAIDENSSMFATNSGAPIIQQQTSWTASPPNHLPSDMYQPSSMQQHLVQQIVSPPRTNGMQGRGGMGAHQLHHQVHQIPQQQPPQQQQQQQQPGGFYPAATPGPPIQTTQNNKGPDGANLFIFHIPNHFTNLNLWHLFCNFGNLLSVRIMVEKDSGRSRGFGFVSYDSPEAAAFAIKELNGYVVCALELCIA